MGARVHIDLVVRGVRYATAQDAAEALGVKPVTVQRAARLGRLDRLGLGRCGKQPMRVRVNGQVYDDAHAAARDLGVGVSAIYQAIHRGADSVGQGRRRGGARSKPVTIGGRRFVSMAALDVAIGRAPGYTSRALRLGPSARLEDIFARVMRLVTAA